MRETLSANDLSSPLAYGVGMPVARAVGSQVPEPHPVLLTRSSRRNALVDILLLIGIAVALELTLGVIAAPFLGTNDNVDGRTVLLTLTLLRGALLVGAVAWILKRRGQSAASVGVCQETWWMTLLFSVVAAVGAYAALLGSIGIMYLIDPSAVVALQRNPERIASSIPKLHPAMLWAVSMFVGFYEELLFRGFVLTRLRRASGSASVAVIVSAALFALPHAGGQELIAIIPIFGLGLVWAVLTLWRRSVLPAMLGHGIFNSLQLTALYYFEQNWH